jgi:hypothetical protein
MFNNKLMIGNNIVKMKPTNKMPWRRLLVG